MVMATGKAPQLQKMLFEESVPLEHRVQMLGQLCLGKGTDAMKLVGALLEAAASAKSESIYKEKIEKVNELLGQLAQGPLRPATFVMMITGTGPAARARVVLEDGSTCFVTVPDETLAGSLRCGDTVLVDAQGKALLFREPHGPDTGEEARLERCIDDGRIEVSVREHERFVFRASDSLARGIEQGEVQPGRTLLVCTRQRIAFEALPLENGLSRYVYLAQEPVPDVTVERDVGAPPDYIEEVIDIVRLEMSDPELCRRYALHPCTTRLLAGPTGTGKTHSINALWRELYVLMSEFTGVSVEELPPRVMRLRMSEVLSHWLGDSDKNLDRFFNEVEQLAGEPFEAPDGRHYTLPALVILEEIDGLARSRGHEPVYDRILTTALQRLDTSRSALRDRLILFVATTNVAHQVDPAFLRRVGGRVEHFGRLGRSAFVAVLDKQLGRRPVAVRNGAGQEAARRQLIAEVTAGLFGPRHADRGQVELHFAGSTTPAVKYRHDFLSGSVVQNAVQQASTASCLTEYRGCDAPGLTSELLICAIEEQVRGIVDNLHESNVHQYTDIPDGVHIASLRRLRQASIQPVQLDSAA
jgi:ATP-dependent 26S proteasome regulatory subunit